MKKSLFILSIMYISLIIRLFAHENIVSSPFFWGFAIEGFPISKVAIDNLKQETNIPPQILSFYLQWPEKPGPITRDPLLSTFDNIWKNGAVPCLTWEPMYLTGSNGNSKISYEKIISGKYDPYLISFAQAVRSWHHPVIIRFAHEMNTDIYHWGTDKNDFGENSPEIYIKMYRYVVNIFRKEHVDNVLWAFCPNSESFPSYPWNRARSYYPGDSYVDILGMDGYNWGIQKNHIWNSSWKSFSEIFTSLYKELKTIAPHKPILVFETASENKTGDKVKWLKEAMKTSKEWGLKGIIWFQISKEKDWRIQIDSNNDVLLYIRTTSSSAQSWAKDLLLRRSYIHF